MIETKQKQTHFFYQTEILESVRLKQIIPRLDPPRVFWAEPGHPPLLASGASQVYSSNPEDRFESIRRQTQSIQLKNRSHHDNSIPRSARPRFFGGFSFTPGSAQSTRWEIFRSGRFVLPRIQFTETAGKVWMTVIDQDEDNLEARANKLRRCVLDSRENGTISNRHVESMSQKPTRDDWIALTGKTIEAIHRTSLEKVVLARALDLRADRSLTTQYLHHRLEQAPESTYRFLFNPRPGHSFIGATPENLIELKGNTLRTESLAGTIEAGKTEEESRKLAKNLASNPKDQNEHQLVVKTLKNKLQELVSRLEFGDQTVRRFPSVQHLYTPVKAKLKQPTHILKLVEKLHPTPAVGGIPSPDFQKYLSDYEPFARGWYASPVGWFNEEGDGRFAVAIRSALVEGRQARLFAGAGIVEDSRPEKEWDEVQWKFQSLLDILVS